ncbi:wax ester/triacylglycerol synthase family O-acyltransferase [Streptomyces sp. NPDC002073]|uniref:wax ester/triacylglycerol synthase family O-acyltransferase n=1 Tax=Streptomyces sp. NBC_00239 TaxID=2903640 RepID=UPI002E28B976|nr:wax ester/triacylglycerol synthase family O-acyltransferase [Streptomyces sp. NBC_00239]
MATEHLSPLDLAFWRIESSGHPMHLGALAVFTADRPGAAARAAAQLTARCAGVPRLRHRIQDVLLPVGAAAWVPDPDFDPSRHVFLAPGNGPGPHEAAGALMARPLDRERPPWAAHVLPGPGGPDDGSFAVLFKFHHALADGLGALALAAALFDGPADGGPGAGGPGGAVPRTRRRSASAAAERDRPLLTRLPGVLAARVQDLGQALEIGAAVARAGLPFGVPDGLTSTGADPGRRAVAGATLGLEQVNRIRRAAGGTVNDVLITLVAGGLRRWLEARGERLDGSGTRALVPVSRRRRAGRAADGNRLSGYLVSLPLAEPDPLARLDAVRAEMDRNKEAGPNRGAGAVALLADHVHPLGHRLGGPLVARAAQLLFDILVTSVPLPGLAFTLAGSALREVYPLAPLACGQSLAVAVSTYRDAVHFGLVADAASVPDLADLASALHAELDALLAAATEPAR